MMRVLSYNIHKGIGGRDRQYRFHRILQILQEIRPDIVCLQEVDCGVKRTRFDDQPAMLQSLFSTGESSFRLTLAARTGGYGNWMWSRWGFVQQTTLCLTLRGRKPRAAQLAVIDSPFGRWQVVNWHLGLVEHERQWQARRLLEDHRFRQHAELPTLIIGDTNDWRHRLARGPFAVHRFQELTAPSREFRSFPAWWPIVSLDKAFYRGPRYAHRTMTVRSPLIRDASDHIPLLVEWAGPDPGSPSELSPAVGF